MPERIALARDNALPRDILMEVSRTYLEIAAKITGREIEISANPKAEICDILKRDYGIID
jgi:phosphoribosylaminoimidazole-succinocarboxamide synthase